MLKTPDPSGVSPIVFEHVFDRLEAQKKIGGAGALTPVSSPPNHCKGVAMSRVPGKVRDTRQLIALEYLSLTKEHLIRAETLRLHYMQLAREYGITNQEIGDALGVSEVAVRRMIQRAE